MNRGLERILTLTFGKEGNEANHLGGGWSEAEPGFRWMVGRGSEIWLEYPGPGHDLILELTTNIMTPPGGASPQRLLVGVRNTAIAEVSMVRGGTVGFHIPSGMLATPGPVRLAFIHPDFRRPTDVGAGTDERQLSFSAQAMTLWRVLPRARPGDAPYLAPDEMIARFESLGDNCEFGLVRRQLNAEPLGLLRFSFIELPQLLRGLRTDFEGLGDPANTEVIVHGKDSEFVVKESAYGMTYHTFQYEGQLSIDAVRLQQSTRLSFLRRKFMEDARGGEKIFVIKRNHTLRPEEVLPIYTQLNDLGLNWLLWVVPANAEHRSGTVEFLLPGLLRGYVDRFAPNENAPDLSLAAWRAVAEAAWRAVGAAVGQDKAN
jgi:hypothetical protein